MGATNGRRWRQGFISALLGLAMAAVVLGAVTVARAWPLGDRDSRANPCQEARDLSHVRAREAEAAYEQWRATSGASWPRSDSYRNRFAVDDQGAAKRALTYAVARYSAVVTQNAACFNLAQRSDAEALVRAWSSA